MAEIIKKNTGVKYSRTITSTGNFDKQDNLYRFNPSVYYVEANFEEIVDKFLALETDKPQLLYIWGHSYELDINDGAWENFDRICKKMSGKEDIFYGTNKEVLF